MTDGSHSWTEEANKATELAEKARSSGDYVTMIASLAYASQCLQMARSFERCEKLLDGRARSGMPEVRHG